MTRKPLHISRVFLAVIWLFLLNRNAFSQAVFSSEEDLKKQANKLFEEEEFGKAYPLFSQLLSLYPKDPQYNYKFGTCLLFASNDKEKAIPYIEFAAKRQKPDVDKEVFFYLGKAYHLNYRFADAIRSYTTYKGMSSSKQITKYDVDRQMEMCENGKRLLKNITDLSVLEKKEVPASDFFRSYNLSEFNAKLIVKPEDLKTSPDKKQKDASLMYLSPDRDQIYYSSYGEDGKNGRDIYYVTRTSGGDLSKPTRVSDIVNTKYDEDYAFLHPNGKSLYFCSKGHNSMGGYDIFKSEWDNGTQAWGRPVNMDFAINTPDDDILFISDGEDKSAYFSSRRESPDGRITVYKIKLDRKPLDLAIITGTLTKTMGDRMAKATITVTKVLKDEVLGVFNTNAADGSYTLKLPNGGKFMLSVESAGFKKSSELVVVPIQQEIKPLKQEITLVNENGQDKVIIKNEFDAQVDSADLQLALQYIKAKASLEVSPAEEEVTAVAVEENKTTTAAETKNETAGTAPVTNTDIIEMAYQDSKETQKDANEMRKNSESAQQLAKKKNELSIQKYNEAQELMKTAETMTNQEEKLAQLDRSSDLRKESETLSKESALALTLSNQMDEQATAKQQQADAEIKYAKDLDNAIKTGANEKKMNELLARKEELDKKSEALSSTFPPDMSKQIAETQAQANKSMAKYTDIQQEAEDLQSEAKRLRTEAGNTKNEGVKQNLNQQAEEMEKEAAVKMKEADVYSMKAKQQQAQTDSLKINASLTSYVMKQIQASPETPVAAGTSASSTTTSSTSAAATETTSGTTAVTPVAIPSPYVAVFADQASEAEKKPNELEKEETLAVVYQAWTDSLDKQVAMLNKQLPTTTQAEQKIKIQNKIEELQLSADEKRQKAADSRNKVDNLKLQQALATASAITPVATNTVSTTSSETNQTEPASAPTITGTKNINEYYENKLNQNASITNEYEKKVKEQELYQDWSASLYSESQRLKQEGSSGKAEDAINESKAKQALAIQSADEVTKIKAEKPELVASANLAPSGTAASTGNKTESSTVPVTSSETTTTTNPISSKTESTPGGSSTSTVIAPESLVHKEEYSRFIALKNESDGSRKNAQRQYKQAADIQKISDEQFRESQSISEQMAATNDPNERQKLQERSDDLDKRALRNQAKADSIKALAKNSEAESNSKRTESELYLQSLDKNAYEEITATAAYKTPPETLASTATSSETKTETATQPGTASSVNITNETANNKTETINSNTAQTETVKPNNNSENKVIASENTNTKTETGTLPAETSANTGLPVNTSAASSSEILKYYDAIFDKLEISGPSYSSAQPIPVDVPMPEGLVFKVQIGAFRNPIPQDLFKGIKPITAETTPQGLKRYTAGLFQKFEAANNAKSQVNGLGYRDAFIVAFFNGKRISMNDALAKAKDAGEEINTAAINSGSSSEQTNTNQSSSAGTTLATATDVKSVNGLFYTIQIGVFSRAVSSTQLYNIAPLNSERTDNGLIRYTTGRFNDEAKAVRAKNNIAQKGISDAFVIAYHNGKRISLSAARSLINSEGSSVLAKDTQEFSFIPSENATSAASENTLNVELNKGIVFKVQVGAFKEQVPIAIANRLLANSGRGIKTFRDDNGLMVYTIGEFTEYESANTLKSQLVSNGIDDAFVIAFRDGKKITASAALELIRNR